MKRSVIFLTLTLCYAQLGIAQTWSAPFYITKTDSCLICNATIQWSKKVSSQNPIDPGFGYVWDESIRIQLWPDSLNAKHIAWSFDWMICKSCFERYANKLIDELNHLRDKYLLEYQKENASRRLWWRKYRFREAVEEREKKIRELQEEVNKLKAGK